MLKMRVYAATDIGQQRTINQDYVYATEEQIGPLPNLLIVADGMGGHRGGDYASGFVVEGLRSLIKRSDESEPIKILNQAISEVNKNLWLEAQSNAQLYNMGTTLVVATVVDGKVYVANVGDSRLYLVHENEIMQLTKDHSLVEEMVQNGKLSRDDARYHPKKNMITRAVGIENKVDIDFFDSEIGEKTKILLCSDGLTNMIEDEEIMEITNSLDDLGDICYKLIDRANEEGGKDNISVVLADDVESSTGEEL